MIESLVGMHAPRIVFEQDNHCNDLKLRNFADINASLDTALETITLAQIKANKNTWSFLAVLAAKLTTKPFCSFFLARTTQDSVQDILVGSNIIQGNTTMKLACACAKRNNPVAHGFFLVSRTGSNTRKTGYLPRRCLQYSFIWTGVSGLDTKHLSLLDRKVLVHGRKLMGRQGLSKRNGRQMERSNLLRAIATQYGNFWVWCLARGFAGIKILQAI